MPLTVAVVVLVTLRSAFEPAPKTTLLAFNAVAPLPIAIALVEDASAPPPIAILFVFALVLLPTETPFAPFTNAPLPTATALFADVIAESLPSATELFEFTSALAL